MKFISRFILSIFSLFICHSVYAMVDTDGDGLVDISTLEQLNAIRFNLSGTGLTLTEGGVTDSTGCFGDETGNVSCNGYELLNDLNFDTNADGVMDANDTYWNEGLGWQPIGERFNAFTSIFDGSFFRVRNLYINRPTESYVGLFGAVSGDGMLIGARVRNISVIGELTKVIGSNRVGTIVGSMSRSRIENSYAQVTIQGREAVGGLVGFTQRISTISRSYSYGNVVAEISGGGLVGYAGDTEIRNTYSSVEVSASNYGAGGLVGFASTGVVVIRNYSIGVVNPGVSAGGLIGGYAPNIVNGEAGSYWNVETSGQTRFVGESGDFSSGAIGLTTEEMQCPIDHTNRDCKVNVDIYQNWSNGIWDFGTSSQYPVLILNRKPQRDNDGDDLFDIEDEDDDNDGFSDSDEITCGSDPFIDSDMPTDTDADGLCDNGVDSDDDNDLFSDEDEMVCGSDSLLESDTPVDTDADGLCDNGVDSDDDGDGVPDADDAFPLDATETVDTDGDGIGNNADTDDDGDGVSDADDAFPLDATETVDTDGDGVGNNADTDDDGDGVSDDDDAFPLDSSRSVAPPPPATPAPAPSSGGGGSFSIFFLAFLFMMVANKRRELKEN